MSTIASPRPSIALSSRRGSASTDTTVTSNTNRQHASASDRGSLRRNRAALRDYYGLKQAAPADTRETSPVPVLDAEHDSELDKSGFDPEAYVERLLSNEGIEGVLRVEAGLVGDIRSLDGEKKALVYDNYSKLISATDTIRHMREKMDPMSPTTSTLTPAIGHIAETAAKLSSELGKSHASSNLASAAKEQRSRRVQQETVRWALAAPSRIRSCMLSGQEEAAKQEWNDTSALLDKWQKVTGVDELRHACLTELQSQGST